MAEGFWGEAGARGACAASGWVGNATWLRGSLPLQGAGGVVFISTGFKNEPMPGSEMVLLELKWPVGIWFELERNQFT